MKKIILIGTTTIAIMSLLYSCGLQQTKTTNNVSSEAALIADIPTTQYFTDEAVSENTVEQIVMAGINFPSAMNKQQWHFTVVTNKDVLKQISEDMSTGMPPQEGKISPENGIPNDEDKKSDDSPSSMPLTKKAGIADAPIAIVISSAEESKFDAGLACQNMSAEAVLLGYGTKIISSPTIALNREKQEEYKELLGIPEEQSAVAVLLIGKEDTSIDTEADGYTSATERNLFSDTVMYVE